MKTLAFLLLAAAGDLPQLQTHECLDASFVQERRIESLAQPLLLRGRMHVETGKLLVWEVEEPFAYTYRLSREEIEEVMPDGTVRRLGVEQAPWLAAVGRLMQAALAGDLEQLRDHFEIHVLDTDDEATRIRLTPMDTALVEQVAALELVWNEWPRQLRIIAPGGDTTSIRFDQVTPCKDEGESGS